MIKVVLESPFAKNENHNEVEHKIYARKCMRDCIMRGEAPIASHLLYTQPTVLKDSVKVERTLGIAMGLAWAREADYAVFYTDYGWSKGMKAAKEFYQLIGKPIVERQIYTTQT